MKTLAQLRDNRWFCYAHSAATKDNNDYYETLARIISLMEMAYNIGKQEGDKAVVESLRFGKKP